METPTLDLLMKRVKPLGRKEGKEKLLTILSSLDSIQNTFKVLHVAGTAGKGSTSAMLSQVLSDLNLQVGLITSPHLLSITERIKVNGEEISLQKMEELATVFYKLDPNLRFAEYMILIALAYFKEKKVEYIVCEAFLGGQYDPSNIFTPLFGILTSIGLDHELFLGTSYEEVLKSELGIFHDTIPLFTRIKNPIVIDYAKEKNIPLTIVEENVETNLLGKHQEENAGLVFKALSSLNFDEEQIKLSLKKVLWKGRLEWIEKNVLLDCAHNNVAFDALKHFLDTLQFRRLVVLFAMTEKKNYERDFHPFLFRADQVIYTKTKMFNAADPKKYAPANAEVFQTVGEAYAQALQLIGEEDLLLVCGSVYLVAEVLSLHEKLKLFKEL